jgi:hypothetical protein
MTGATRQTLTVNTLWPILFDHNIGHSVPAFMAPSNNRTVYHPLTWPELVDGQVRLIYTQPDHLLVVDRYLGLLPVVANDEYMARAIGENWTSTVNSRVFQRPVDTGRHAENAQADEPAEATAPAFDPTDRSQVWDWGLGIVRRSPRIRLITEIQWPPGLPPTPFHHHQN